MTLPIDFRFSQNNLQDYVDCPRRFELKYLLKQGWPAIVSEPIQEFEHLQFLGLRFHALVHQHLVGIPVERLETTLDDLNLKRWWNNYLIFIDRYLFPGEPWSIPRLSISIIIALLQNLIFLFSKRMGT